MGTPRTLPGTLPDTFPESDFSDDSPLAADERLDFLEASARPPTSQAIVARRRGSWLRFLEQSALEPIPSVPVWTRFLAVCDRLLPDLASIRITRNMRPIFDHVPELAAGLVKGDGEGKPQPLSTDKSVADRILLETFRVGDLLHMTCVLPTDGALVVLVRDGESTSRAYPRAPEALSLLSAGARVPVRGKLSGSGAHELVVALSPTALPAEVLTLEGDALLELLTALPGLAVIRYGFEVGGE